MKKLFTVLLLLAVCLALQAQDFTKVKGVVVDASGTPEEVWNNIREKIEKVLKNRCL